MANADVDMTGRLEKAGSSSLKSGVEPLSVSSENGDWRCADAYSTVANWPYYYAIGNCPHGAELEAVSYASENPETHQHSYGGFVNGTFSGCGWINTEFPLERLNHDTHTACAEESGGGFRVKESAFWERVNSSSAKDGTYVVNKVPCSEYANYRPWSESNAPKELLRTVLAYEREGSGSEQKYNPALKWRYISKYASTGEPKVKYVMVRDDRIGGGEGNWVFVPRSCLPSTLPSEGELLPPAPTVTTESASGVATPDATLHATVNPNGVATKYTFQYGTSTSYGSETPAGEAGAGTSNVAVQAAVAGLNAGTTYYFRIVASSAIGESLGGPVAFTTQPPPTATTSAASEVHQEQATLNGTVNPQGLDTHYYFQYGTTTEYGSSTPSTDAGSGTSTLDESAIITRTQSSTIYHYRMVATSSAGTVYGSDQLLTTVRAARPAIAVEGSGFGIIWRGSDGNIYDTDAPKGPWQTFSPTWERDGGEIPVGVTPVGDPATVSEAGGGVGIVWRGSDWNIYDTDAPKGTWQTFSPTWERDGGEIPAGVTAVGDPVIVKEGSGFGIVWRGSDGNIYDTDAPKGTWQTFSPTWERDGGEIPAGVTAVGDPVIATEGSGFGIVWRGSDGNIYDTDAPKGTWQTFSPTWERDGGEIPAGVTMGAN
jgi:hypothetical protein